LAQKTRWSRQLHWFNFRFDYRIYNNIFSLLWLVWSIYFGLTLTLLEDQIYLLLTELLGGHFGATLTSVDFWVRVAVDYWFVSIVFGQVNLILVLSRSVELLRNDKRICSKGFPTMGIVLGIRHILCPLVLACLLRMFLCSICIHCQCV